MFKYDKDAQLAVETLDKYNLISVLKWCVNERVIDIWDIKKTIEQFEPELSEALDDLSTDELMEYLRERYGVRFEEVISYHLYHVPNI